MGLLAKVQRAVRHVGKNERRSREAEGDKSRKKSEKQATKIKEAAEDAKVLLESNNMPSSSCAEEKPAAAYSGGTSSKPSATNASVDAFFARYKDSQEDAILAEGMERLCKDMDVDPTDVRLLALAWKFGAVTMCRFSREQFVDGCRKLVVDNPRTLRDVLPTLIEEGRRSFRDFYKFTFDFGLESGERCLSREMAIALWRLVLPVSDSQVDRFTGRWCAFLEQNRVRGVTRDCWMVFLEFCQVVDEDFANYSDEDAWPSLLDEFVDDQLQRRHAVVGCSSKRKTGYGSDD